MSNILIVESKNDKIFLEALINHLNYDIKVDTPICIDDYEELKGLNETKLIKTLKELKADIPERGIEKIGIIIDIDDQGTDKRLEMVNNCIKNVFDNTETLKNTSELIKLNIDDVTEIEIACYFTNVDNKGELETVLKTIKTQESPHAECLNDWRKCLENKGYGITDKDFDKFWISIYLRYDTCSKKDQRQAGRKCTMNNFDYIMENKSNIWNFEHPILQDLKTLQYITNQKGEKVAVILPIAEFEELLMDLEDLKDINERKNETTIDHQDLITELKEDSIL